MNIFELGFKWIKLKFKLLCHTFSNYFKTPNKGFSIKQYFIISFESYRKECKLQSVFKRSQILSLYLSIPMQKRNINPESILEGADLWHLPDTALCQKIVCRRKNHLHWFEELCHKEKGQDPHINPSHKSWTHRVGIVHWRLIEFLVKGMAKVDSHFLRNHLAIWWSLQ